MRAYWMDVLAIYDDLQADSLTVPHIKFEVITDVLHASPGT